MSCPRGNPQTSARRRDYAEHDPGTECCSRSTGHTAFAGREEPKNRSKLVPNRFRSRNTGSVRIANQSTTLRRASRIFCDATIGRFARVSNQFPTRFDASQGLAARREVKKRSIGSTRMNSEFKRLSRNGYREWKLIETLVFLSKAFGGNIF